MNLGCYALLVYFHCSHVKRLSVPLLTHLEYLKYIHQTNRYRSCGKVHEEGKSHVKGLAHTGPGIWGLPPSECNSTLDRLFDFPCASPFLRTTSPHPRITPTLSHGSSDHTIRTFTHTTIFYLTCTAHDSGQAPNLGQAVSLPGLEGLRSTNHCAEHNRYPSWLAPGIMTSLYVHSVRKDAQNPSLNGFSGDTATSRVACPVACEQIESPRTV